VWSLHSRSLLHVVELPRKVVAIQQLDFLPDCFDAGSNKVSVRRSSTLGRRNSIDLFSVVFSLSFFGEICQVSHSSVTLIDAVFSVHLVASFLKLIIFLTTLASCISGLIIICASNRLCQGYYVQGLMVYWLGRSSCDCKARGF